MDIRLKNPILESELNGFSEEAKAALKAHEGLWIPVETEYLFRDQFNTTIDGVGIRVHCRLVDKVRDDCRLGMPETNREAGKVMVAIGDKGAMKVISAEEFLKDPNAEPYQTIEMRMQTALEQAGLPVKQAAFNAGIPVPQMSRIRLRVDQYQRLAAQINPFLAVSALNLSEYLDQDKLGYCGMFATFDSLSEVFDYIENMSGAERRAATVAYGITVNTLLNMLGLVKPD